MPGVDLQLAELVLSAHDLARFLRGLVSNPGHTDAAPETAADLATRLNDHHRLVSEAGVQPHEALSAENVADIPARVGLHLRGSAPNGRLTDEERRQIATIATSPQLAQDLVRAWPRLSLASPARLTDVEPAARAAWLEHIQEAAEHEAQAVLATLTLPGRTITAMTASSPDHPELKIFEQLRTAHLAELMTASRLMVTGTALMCPLCLLDLTRLLCAHPLLHATVHSWSGPVSGEADSDEFEFGVSPVVVVVAADVSGTAGPAVAVTPPVDPPPPSASSASVVAIPASISPEPALAPVAPPVETPVQPEQSPATLATTIDKDAGDVDIDLTELFGRLDSSAAPVAHSPMPAPVVPTPPPTQPDVTQSAPDSTDPASDELDQLFAALRAGRPTAETAYPATEPRQPAVVSTTPSTQADDVSIDDDLDDDSPGLDQLIAAFAEANDTPAETVAPPPPPTPAVPPTGPILTDLADDRSDDTGPDEFDQLLAALSTEEPSAEQLSAEQLSAEQLSAETAYPTTEPQQAAVVPNAPTDDPTDADLDDVDDLALDQLFSTVATTDDTSAAAVASPEPPTAPTSTATRAADPTPELDTGPTSEHRLERLRDRDVALLIQRLHEVVRFWPTFTAVTDQGQAEEANLELQRLAGRVYERYDILKSWDIRTAELSDAEIEQLPTTFSLDMTGTQDDGSMADWERGLTHLLLRDTRLSVAARDEAPVTVLSGRQLADALARLHVGGPATSEVPTGGAVGRDWQQLVQQLGADQTAALATMTLASGENLTIMTSGDEGSLVQSYLAGVAAPARGRLPRYLTYPPSHSTDDGWARHLDPEKKLFDYLATNHHSALEEEALTVTLLTTDAMCPSCCYVALQFLADFPRVTGITVRLAGPSRTPSGLRRFLPRRS